MKKRYAAAGIGLLVLLLAGYVVQESKRPAEYYIKKAEQLERDDEEKLALIQWRNAKNRSLKNTGDNTAEIARICIGLADCAEDRDEAYEDYQKAMDIYESLEDEPGMAEAYRRMGTMYRMNGEKERARDYLGRAEAYYGRYGETDPTRLYELNLDLSVVSGEYEEELARLRTCEELLPSLPEETRGEETITVYNNLCSIFYRNKHYEEAMEYFPRLLEAYEKEGAKDYGGMANAYHYYGYTYALNKDAANAKKYIEEAIRICGKMTEDESYEELAMSYLHMAEIYGYLETPPDYETALQYGVKACQCYGDRKTLANEDFTMLKDIVGRLKEIYQAKNGGDASGFEQWLGERVTINANSYMISFP